MGKHLSWGMPETVMSSLLEGIVLGIYAIYTLDHVLCAEIVEFKVTIKLKFIESTQQNSLNIDAGSYLERK